jgi:dihydroflavonol-4-reductase
VPYPRDEAKTLVTGATGLLGARLVARLTNSGTKVRALVRDAARAGTTFGPAVELAVGDVTDPSALVAAMRGVEQVYHLAGIPEQWLRDPRVFHHVNCIGTKNVLTAARAASVTSVVHASTMDVFDAPRAGRLDETCPTTTVKPTAYERSKQAAELEVEKAVQAGQRVVMVHPAAIYGPTSSPTTTNAFIARLLRGKVPLLPPGGMSLVYVDGVVEALIAAATRASPGERYLLSDGHLSTEQLAHHVMRIAGGHRKIPATCPPWILAPFATLASGLASLTGRPPLVSVGELVFLRWDARVDAHKAVKQLGFEPTPLSVGLELTVRYFSGLL